MWSDPHIPSKRERARRGPFWISVSPSVARPGYATVTSYAEKDVPQPQLDLACGLMKVKPPCSPSVT